MREHYTAFWVCQNMPWQGSEYRVLNAGALQSVLSMPEYALTEFWIQGFQYASVTQRSEYVRICLDIVLNISRVLNMPGLWIWYGSDMRVLHRGCSKYATIWLHMSEFTTTDMTLNMSHIMHCARTLYKLISTYWEMGIFRALSKIKDRALWKNNYSFLTIFANHSILNLLEF